MEQAAVRPATRWPRALSRVDVRALSIWGLAGAIVLYLAIDGGGYDIVVRNQIGLAVWWVVFLGAIGGVLPATRPTRVAWSAIALLGAFVLWTALASTWSQSSQRSLDELSRVACYLGVFVLAVTLHRDRESAARHTVGAIAAAVVVVAGLAVFSRLRPGTFPGATQTATFLPGADNRLAWPLQYWNGLAALMALGLPLLLAVASSARRLMFQALAAGAVPLVALCGYLTFSRGGAGAAAAGLIVFYCLTGDRIPKLLTGLGAAAGSAVLIAGAVHRRAIEDGFANAAARHQGDQLLIAVLLVCAGTAIMQVGIALAVRHGTAPRWLHVPRRRAQALTAAVVAVGLVVAIAVGVPGKLSHAWHQFKQPPTAVLNENTLSRFGSASGNGRYQYWKVGVDALPGHVVRGWGPGTFQLVYLPRAPDRNYVMNAHSLYVETLVEDGLIGLAVLVAFLAVVLVRGIGLVFVTRWEGRARAAAVVGACVAFLVSAAVDWVWQIPVLPVCFLLLAAATMAPVRRRVVAGSRTVDEAGAGHGSDVVAAAPVWRRRAIRGGLAAIALASLVAIVVPLTMTNALRQSQAAVARHDVPDAVSYARVATQIEPGAASAQLQSALVLELQGKLAAAASAARRATVDEPLNWSAWLVRSRLEVETGHPAAGIAALRRARALNPRSPLFQQQ